jgi:hypothetical protein
MAGTEAVALYLNASRKRLLRGWNSLLWDPVSRMSPETREEWRRSAIPVALAAFDGTSADFWAEQWSDEELGRLSVLNVAVDDSGRAQGWVSGRRTQWGGQRVLYAASAGVSPDVQGGGLSAALWRRVVLREVARAFPRPLFVVLRTGNPLVYDAWTAAGGAAAVSPRPGTPVPAHVVRIARGAAEYLCQARDLDPSTLRIKEAYRAVPGGLWRLRPRSRDEGTNAWFENSLGPTDAFVVVTRFTLLSVARGAVSSARRRTRAAAP